MDPKRFECKDKPTPENQVATTRTLLALSTEVLVEVLAYLQAADMITMQRTCRTIRDIIAGTAYLQYLLRARMNGVEDLLPPNFPHSERLELLRRHEESWRRSHLNVFTERQRVPLLHRVDSFILQGGYLIYECLIESRYGYTDLCSAARNEELHWVHVTLSKRHYTFSMAGVFAVDHDLVTILTSNMHWRVYNKPILVQVAFFEFTTGAPHPLSSTHTLLLPPLSGFSEAFVDAKVLGDHILVIVRNLGEKNVLYMVSWKTGTVTLLRGSLDKSTNIRTGKLTTVVINSSLIALIRDGENSLEICKLEIASPAPRLQTLCFLELPLLVPGASFYLSKVHREWISTSTSYTGSRSSRGYHLPFYSSTVCTIVLGLGYKLPRGVYHPYAIVISVESLLSAIPPDVRNVPWLDWGPSGTHFFETRTRTYLIPIGPFLISDPLSALSLVVRHYDLWHTRSTQWTAEYRSSQQSRSPSFISAEVFQHDVKTHLKYRDVVMDEMNLYDYAYIVADREWVVRVGPLEEGPSVTVYHVGQALGSNGRSDERDS